MTYHPSTDAAVDLQPGRKDDLRVQVAALCYKQEEKKTRILLITSRETKRWIIPRGWPMHGCTPGQAAGIEAYEEAGVVGKLHGTCIGSYAYQKRAGKDRIIPCLVLVYPLKVKRLMKKYPEAGERKRKWVSRKQAAEWVIEPALRRIIMEFDPRLL